MDHGRPGHEWAIDSYILTQPKRWIGLFGGSPDPLKKSPHRCSRNLVFLFFPRPIQGIQGIALDELLGESPKSLLMAKAFQACDLSVYCEYSANLAIHQAKVFEILTKAIPLPLK
jgi:hypothetical protein